MKHPLRFVFVLIVAIGLSACVGMEDTASNSDRLQNNSAQEEGFDFTEDGEGEGIAVSGSGESADIPEGDSQEDEALDEIELDESYLPDEDETNLPQWGNWFIQYDEGVMICEDGMTMGLAAAEAETIEIQLSSEQGTIYIYDLGEGGQRLDLTLVESGPGGAEYTGTVNAGGTELLFTFFFLVTSEDRPFDWLEGSIKSEEQGCKITRSFVGQPTE